MHFRAACIISFFSGPDLGEGGLPSAWAEVICPVFLVALTSLVLHLLDRQLELTSRSDFLWRSKLSSEEEGVETMRGINKILLENILPGKLKTLHRVTPYSNHLWKKINVKSHSKVESLLSDVP